MIKPKVIVRTNFMLALNNPDRDKRTNEKDIKYTNKMLDYYANDKKRALNMLDYFTGKIGKSDDINLILESGKKASVEDIRKRKKYISSQFQNSNIWQIVLSFDETYINKNISWDDLEMRLAKEILPKIFKKMGFIDSKKMCYQFSLHTNTENPHFHISFMERVPNSYSKDGRIIYRRKGKIPQNVIRFLKLETCLCVERNHKFKPMSISINQDLEELKKYFAYDSYNFVLKDKSNILLEEKILDLGKMLYERDKNQDKKIKFNSIKNEQIKALTREIKNELFRTNENIILSKKKFEESIKMFNDYIIELGKNNNVKKNNLNFSYIYNKENYLDNYVLNAIVNYAKHHFISEVRKVKVTSNDIIQEIILNNYKKNKNYTKKDILCSALAKNNIKFKNKYEIQKAIKNINEELEEAANEFHKLFVSKHEKTL